MNSIQQIPFSRYLELDRFGSSDLRNMRVGPPALVKWKRENREESDAMKLGTAAHCAILTPWILDDQYALKPEGMTFASKEGKAWRDAHEGRTILTFIEHQDVGRIEMAFRNQSTCAATLKGAGLNRIEASVVWDCPVSGLRSKGRPDFYDDEAVYDLKISRFAANPAGLAFRAYTEGWMHQLAHNRAGLRAAGEGVTRGRLIVISPKPPHDIHISLLEVKPDALDLLELENERTRAAIAECDRSGIWPGLPIGWQLIEPPVSALIETMGILDSVEVTSE